MTITKIPEWVVGWKHYIIIRIATVILYNVIFYIIKSLLLTTIYIISQGKSNDEWSTLPDLWPALTCPVAYYWPVRSEVFSASPRTGRESFARLLAPSMLLKAKPEFGQMIHEGGNVINCQVSSFPFSDVLNNGVTVNTDS
jgi:hypothetical protein